MPIDPANPVAFVAADPRALGLYRCKICGTRWLLWPDAIHGGGWNLLDQWQRPGSCCDNVAMDEQIEHLRDIPLSSPLAVPAAPHPPDEPFAGTGYCQCRSRNDATFCALCHRPKRPVPVPDPPEENAMTTECRVGRCPFCQRLTVVGATCAWCGEHIETEDHGLAPSPKGASPLLVNRNSSDPEDTS